MGGVHGIIQARGVHSSAGSGPWSSMAVADFHERTPQPHNRTDCQETLNMVKVHVCVADVMQEPYSTFCFV